ncbi:hypothetical protein [Pseudomonas mandelii]|uniref:hypothetical protein n=1 Tax=Pseudomonas mandelii TaxID=75612 RepID=UPI00224B3717|nr:hypothetical protein [Pseudomonas mandelii]MCX2901191.1 hypothetical protein [Pseudomonas mandelii]
MSTQNVIETPLKAGELDPAYGSNGSTLVDGSNVVALAIWASEGPDKGKVVGVASKGAQFKLFRLELNGVLDKGFGTDREDGIATGYTTGSFGDPATTTSTVTDLMLVDGKIVLTGRVRDNPPLSPNYPAAARFKAAGAPDLTFGQSGVFTFTEPAPVTDKTSSSAKSAGRKPKSGNILFAVNNSGITPYRDWGLLIQLTTEGNLDPAFNDRGYVFFKHGGESTTTVSAGTQANGNIIVAGSTPTSGFLAGFTAAGNRDDSFGIAGFSTLRSSEGSIELRRLVLQPDQKPVAIGMLKTGTSPTSRHGWVVRTLADGKDDVSFNGGAAHITRITLQGSQWNTGGVDSTGAIVVAGELSTRALSLVGRITAEGQADLTFGVNGVSNPHAAGMPSYSGAIGLQADNNIVVGARIGNLASVTRFQG